MGFCRIKYISLKQQRFLMKKVFLTFLFISMIMVQGVLAQDFSINYEDSMQKEYFATRIDYLSVKINNPLPESWFSTTIFGVPEEWVEVQEPLLRVPGYGTGVVLLKVEPSRDALPGIYQYFLKVERISTHSVIEQPILLNVRQVTSAIIKDVSFSCQKCMEKIDVSGSVYNVGSKKVDLVVVLKLAHMQKTINIGRISITDSKDFEASFYLEYLEPEDYNIEIELIDASGNSLYQESYPFTIPSLEEVYYDQDVSSTPFGSIITLSAENRGNVLADVTLRSINEDDWFYFMSGPSPSGMFLENYIWQASIAPGEKYDVTYSEIYWPIYLFIVTVVIAASFVYYKTSDITFTKNALTTKKFKPGEQLSVSLHLKNKAQDLKRVTIRDLIPAGFSVVNKFEAAKPLIRKVGAGIELFWDVGRLDPHEERFFHYTIKPDHTTVKKTNLPSALVKAMRQRKFFSKRSNNVGLAPEELETTTVTVTVAE